MNSFRNKFLGRLYRGLGVMFIFFSLIGFAIYFGTQNTIGIIISLVVFIIGIVLGFKGIKRLHKIVEW